MAKKDNRIKIINNDRNQGLLYSRAMGILNTIVKFIMNWDLDDPISNQNVLYILYKKTRVLKQDIIIYILETI